MYQNAIWPNVSVPYEKHFLYVSEEFKNLNTARDYNYLLTKFHGIISYGWAEILKNVL